MGECSETSLGMPLEALTGIESCTGESKGCYKKRRPNDAAVRMRRGWRSRCNIRRLRSSEVLSDF
ncbi:UNVERIFIED_CONTAM: hypothetical protein NCL1_27866 [Trichonephila clavipes]